MHVISASPSLRQAAELQQNTNNGLTINNSCGRNTPSCNIALMGIHFMIRLEESDPLRVKGGPPWVFITLWWTGRDNGTNLPSPWKYYQINVTQGFRNDSSPGSVTSNICFNPYLEGKKPFGAVSNCVNCHYFA